MPTFVQVVALLAGLAQALTPRMGTLQERKLQAGRGRYRVTRHDTTASVEVKVRKDRVECIARADHAHEHHWIYFGVRPR